MFMKTYGKERTMCSLVGESGSKPFLKWMWIFIEAVTNFKEYVVSFFLSLFSCFFILLIHPIYF